MSEAEDYSRAYGGPERTGINLSAGTHAADVSSKNFARLFRINFSLKNGLAIGVIEIMRRFELKTLTLRFDI